MAMHDVLTQDEIDALLHGIEGGAVETEEERKRREAKASERDTSASKTTAKSTEVIEVESSGSGYVQPIIATKRNGESGER